MSHADLADAAIIRSTDAEVLTAQSASIALLLDSNATGGALSAHRTWLRDGADGASPHRHTRSSELFYVLDGTVDLLAGSQTLTATVGDLVVVAPGAAHAFAAHPGCDGELLVVITPGIERFDLFRRLVQVLNGSLDRTQFLADQDRFDTYRADSPTWQQARTSHQPTMKGST